MACESVILYGNGKMAELVLAVMRDDRRYRVCAVTADLPYITGADFQGIPQLPVGEATRRFPPAKHGMLVTVGYRRMRDRRDMFARARGFGYRLINYVAPRARVYPDLQMGENNILFDDVYVGPSSRIGSHNVIRPQSYVGHSGWMGDHAFVAPGVIIGGGCRIGDLTFLGIGSTVVDGIKIGEECLLAAGSLLTRDAEPCGLYLGQPAKRIRELSDTGVVVGG